MTNCSDFYPETQENGTKTIINLLEKPSDMGSIISSKVRDDDKVVIEVCIDKDEALQLKGNLNDIHIFAEGVVDVDTHLSLRGKNEATKYFLIPKQLRRDLEFSRKVRCQKIETGTKVMFVYVLDKY
jgi:hypothetical protein